MPRVMGTGRGTMLLLNPFVKVAGPAIRGGGGVLGISTTLAFARWAAALFAHRTVYITDPVVYLLRGRGLR